MSEIKKNSISKKIDKIPSHFLVLDRDDNIIASMSSNLGDAKGNKVLIKSAVKQYIDRNITDRKDILDTFIYTSSNLISCGDEKLDGKVISYKPSFFHRLLIGIEIQTKNNEIVFDKQNVIKKIVDKNYIILQTKINEILATIDGDSIGCMIFDESCDGTEKTKFYNRISIGSSPSTEIRLKSNSYQYFRHNDEIMYAKIDTNQYVLEDILRGSVVNNDKINELQVLSNNDTMKMLKSVLVFYDFNIDDIVLLANTRVYSIPNSEMMNSVNGDIYFDNTNKEWKIYQGGRWYSHNGYMYLGDLIYDNNTFVGFRYNDLKFILDNVSNLDLRVSGDTAYTNSDKTYLTVLNKYVEFEIDRLKWDLSNYKNNNEVYLYIDGDGKTICDTLKPLYVDIVGYYKHYYHYWRCVGKAVYDINKWIVYSEKELKDN